MADHWQERKTRQNGAESLIKDYEYYSFSGYLKMHMKCVFLLLNLTPRVIKGLKISSFGSKSARTSYRNQSKSIKFVTSCAGHVDGMKKLIGNNSSTIRQNQVKLSREEVDGHFQLLMLRNWFSGLRTRSQTSLIVNINPSFLQSW